MTRTTRSALTRCLLLAGILVAIYFVAFAAVAKAGTYRVVRMQSGAECGACARSCGGRTGGNVVRIAGRLYTGNRARGRPGWKHTGPGVYGDSLAWELRAPGGTIIRNMEVWWKAAANAAVTARVEARDDSGGRQVWANVPYTDFLNCNTPVTCPGARNDGYCSLSNPGQLMSARNIFMELRCGEPTVSACVPTGGAYAYMKELDVTLEDLRRPADPTLGGSLAAGGPRRGTESLLSRLLTLAAASGQSMPTSMACRSATATWRAMRTPMAPRAGSRRVRPPPMRLSPCRPTLARGGRAQTH